MYKKELELERQKLLEKQLWRCGKCKFSNYNYGMPHVKENYCHIREERMDKVFVSDFFKILFCSHFKEI